jgi:hypothetical protein
MKFIPETIVDQEDIAHALLSDRRHQADTDTGSHRQTVGAAEGPIEGC